MIVAAVFRPMVEKSRHVSAAGQGIRISASLPRYLPDRRGSASVISNHGAFTATKMCRLGWTSGSSSSVPAGMLTMSASTVGKGPPQIVQKVRRYPGGLSRTGASQVLTRAPPLNHRNSESFKVNSALNAEPLDFRQRGQWSRSKPSNVPEAS